MTGNVLLVILVLVLIWAVFAYNKFITLINRAKEAWSDIDIQLKRRYDLIPNLVNTVKGYAAHESEAFENVTKARAAATRRSAGSCRAKSLSAPRSTRCGGDVDARVDRYRARGQTTAAITLLRSALRLESRERRFDGRSGAVLLADGRSGEALAELAALVGARSAGPNPSRASGGRPGGGRPD